MSSAAITALSIFIVVYIFIVSEKIHRTVIALTGAMLMILCGILTQEMAIHHIDFNTIGLLVGMMIVVSITGTTGLFNYLAIWAAKKVKAKPLKLLVALSLLTGVCSAFLDNVTTVLLTVPLTFSITKKLNIPVKPFLIAQILASNIGGTSTLIGDPPNIMIGSAVPEMDFMAFISNLGIVCIVIFAVTMAILLLLYRKQLVTVPQLQAKVMAMNEYDEIKDSALLKKCLFVLFLIIVTFVLHSQLHLESATVALSGAAILMLISISRDERKISKVLSNVEWLAIFFFAGLFILVGGLVETGVIKMMAERLLELTSGDLTKTTMLILWLSAIASAFIDNIPFVATLIPMIKDMGTMGMSNLEPLWWALSLGACLGGNGTIIGASANVVVASMAAMYGEKLSFGGYFIVAFPIMIISIVISTIYLLLFYL
ncbi:SLC13 family permease [Megamonas hypermegale]|uniref:SLC13 family permease n=1 Tax=Megamonas hypermegale TaxID=158847 RepID=UPI00195C14DF|nr:ArsB/NhaD family transporter [Megamonas hypermegale]MBM6832606.1 ArsB/NhaD family transporter [Megamonas hypermegale]